MSEEVLDEILGNTGPRHEHEVRREKDQEVGRPFFFFFFFFFF